MLFDFFNFVKTPVVSRPSRVSQMSQTSYNIDNKFQLFIANMDSIFFSGMLLYLYVFVCICVFCVFFGAGCLGKGFQEGLRPRSIPGRHS